MKRTKAGKLRWWFGIGLLLFPGGSLLGEEPQQSPTVSGRVEVGVRQLAGSRDSSKFEEYRDIPEGFFVQNFRITLESLFKRDYSLNFQTRETLEHDQSYLLSFGRPGKFRLELRWDETPHDFTNRARSFYLESSPGVFTLPATTRSALQANSGLLPDLLQGARAFDVSLRRRLGSGMFLFTPSPDWSLQFQYSKERLNGVRPFGTTTNSFTNTIELPEPLDYRTQQVKTGVEYARRGWGFQVNYLASFFKNEISELVWDNAFRLTDTASAASRGRIDLYPDNSAHSLSFAGAFNITGSTRFISSVVPGWMRQDDPFLPFTINAAVAGIPPLPASSLDGKKKTLAMTHTLTSSAIPSVTFTARYRLYDYDNNTPSLLFSNYVRTDAGLGGVARKNLPYAYSRQDLNFDASWEFLRGQSLKFIYEWERFHRRHRDADRSAEHTFGAVVDVSRSKWLLFRVSYRYSDREPRHYEPNEESFPFGEPATALGQLHELRKFDEAARHRHRAESLLQLTPTDTLAFSASYGTTQHRYNESEYGLLGDLNTDIAFDLTYSPRPELSFFAEYAREKYSYSQRSRQRVPGNDTPNNDWGSQTRDLVDTWGTGMNLSLWKHRVVFDGYFNLSAAKGIIHTSALGVPGVPGFLPTTAVDYPNTSNRFHQAVSSLRFPLWENVTPKLEYRYERYGRMDFQIDRLNPFMVPLDSGTGTSVFLGADVPGYNAHVFAIALEYVF